MYLGRTLTIIGVTYMSMHIVSGALLCYNEFCPGDRENDWVYEYADDSGKQYVVVQGKAVPKDEYTEEAK